MTYSYHQDESFDGKEVGEEIFSEAILSLKRDEKLYLKLNQNEWKRYLGRVEKFLPDLISIYFDIYGSCVYAYPLFLELIERMTRSWIIRDESLKQLDSRRGVSNCWFQSNQIVGGVCYVDLFANDLKRLEEKIPYFKELGLNYLHLMPLFKISEGENDGGYAISSYRETNKKIGAIEDLRQFAGKLRENGISLALDFVFNHTSDEHDWALKAKKGDNRYRNFYWMFENRNVPDQYDAMLREIFPNEHPGAFSWVNDIKQWIWTTFHSYQWDLNYQNPEVFIRMAEEMLFIANLGVDVLRLDAVAFIWKQKGTVCENLPQAYKLIDAFNLIARIVAPNLQFKSEAIVHPDEVIRYISPKRCQISYNPLLMALMWEALATRDTKLLSASLRKHFTIPEGTAWINYIRCHDDIGWTFSDEDAAELWINGYYHRQFLNKFYTGKFPGSFAKGLPFQENLITGDCRISGTLASLTGLEKAENDKDSIEEEMSINRILLLYGVIMTIGGIPLIYLGDEIGSLNDYSYQNDISIKDDSRWVHRSRLNKERFELRYNLDYPSGRIWQGVRKLIQIRKNYEIFSSVQTKVIDSKNPHIFAYSKFFESQKLLVLANFSEHDLILENTTFDSIGNCKYWTELLTRGIQKSDSIQLMPYQIKYLFSEKINPQLHNKFA